MTRAISRREFLQLAAVSGSLAFIPTQPGSPARADAPLREWVTRGEEFAELASFDSAVQDFMQARAIPGGALAVTYQSKLVLARGYTYTDDVEDLTVEPTSLFRIASVSKPITATAILRLVQDGQLDLSAKVTDLLDLTPPTGQTPDARLGEITVRHLLQHLGGWDRDIAYDPMFYDSTIANALGLALPIARSDIVTYVTGHVLQHAPGSTQAYSNYGYCLLGMIIEEITGESYSSYVKRAVLDPLDISRMVLGRSLISNRLPNEVKYHSQYNNLTVVDNTRALVALPYGAWNLENMDAHGGWLASAVDIVRFASTFDDPNSSPVLNAQSMEILFGLPENIAPEDYETGDYYYACGWAVRDYGVDGRNTWHDGSLPGTSTLLVRRRDGISWCVLFNQRDDPSGLNYGEIDGLLHTAADAVTDWPTHDLFDQYLTDEQQVYLPILVK